MIRDYGVVSPSLDGVLRHESMMYEGLKRPPELARIFDRPSPQSPSDSSTPAPTLDPSDTDRRARIEEYFHDLYGILMKRISQFAIESEPPQGESLMLIAMLQEFVKVKGLLASSVVK